MKIRAEIQPIRRQPSASGKRKLPLPMSDDLRVAQVNRAQLLFADSRYFSPDDTSSLLEFLPQVLVGSAAELEGLARNVGTDAADELAVQGRALIVLTNCRDVPLRESTRLTLWRAFGLPTYELLLSGDGTPIASECDAHEGWHVEEAVTFSVVNGELWFQRKRDASQGTGLTGTIEDSICPCGKPGKRILNASMDLRDPLRNLYLAKTA